MAVNKRIKIISALLCAAVVISVCGCDGAGTSQGVSKDSAAAQTSGADSAVSSESSEPPAASAEGGDNESTSSAEGESIPADNESSDAAQSSAESAPQTSGQESGADDKPENLNGIETNGHLVVDIDGHTWGISLYGGGSGANYASYVNEFKELVGDNVNVFSMVIPTSSAFYLPAGYETYNASETDSISNIANQLSGVINVDACSVLASHRDEYIYTRTDHHWQPLGAYYAAAAFCDAALSPAKPLSEYTPVSIEGFVGTMYAETDYNIRLKDDPDTFTYYIPSGGYKATYYTADFEIDENVRLVDTLFIPQTGGDIYCTFMGGDNKIVKVVTENKNGRRLCVFKDSYGNAEIPCFVDSFEEIYVCDIRHFQIYAPDFVKENNITDVLFTMCIFSAVGGNAECIKNDMLAKH